VIVAVGFLVAVVAAILLMAYIAWRGSKPSDFFLEAVQTTYGLELPEAEIDAYYDLKDRLKEQHSAPPEAAAPDDPGNGTAPGAPALWVQRLPPEEHQNLQRALMRRLVANMDKLDQVHNDKPGNWKLWRAKLVSERYWMSLCEAERLVSEEINSCVAEADELNPGWHEHIFQQALHYWTMGKQQDMEKRMQKKAVEQGKKEKEKEVKRKEVEERKKEEDKQRQERLAEKAMEKLLREEEQKAASAKSKAKAGATKQAPTSKTKGKKS